jgi:S1-C subfamily serine protease
MPNLVQLLNDEMAVVVDRIRPSVVQVTDGRGNGGAGTIWHPDGLILTNAHVIAHGGLKVTLLDGQTYPAQVIAQDENNDVAALAIDANGLPTIEPGDSTRVRPGQWVMALGHPWGVLNVLTAGIVIGAGSDLPEMHPGRDWLALGLKLRPGHSGGPLVDVNARIIGINTMISGPEIGYAVPVHVVKAFLKERLGSRVAATIPEPLAEAI